MPRGNGLRYYPHFAQIAKERKGIEISPYDYMCLASIVMKAVVHRCATNRAFFLPNRNGTVAFKPAIKPMSELVRLERHLRKKQKIYNDPYFEYGIKMQNHNFDKLRKGYVFVLALRERMIFKKLLFEEGYFEKYFLK